jgi:hypothetical protein
MNQIKNKQKNSKIFIEKESNTEKIKNTKNIHINSNNMTLQPDQIRWKQRHRHFVNHAKINNLASIYFDYQIIIMIWSKWVSILN